jgi:hypothetical protein
MWFLDRFALHILRDPSQTIATAMLFRTITQAARPYRPKIPHPGEISGLVASRRPNNARFLSSNGHGADIPEGYYFNALSITDMEQYDVWENTNACTLNGRL